MMVYVRHFGCFIWGPRHICMAENDQSKTPQLETPETERDSVGTQGHAAAPVEQLHRPRRPRPEDSKFGYFRDMANLGMLVFAFGFGVYQFIYVNILEVRSLPPALVVSCTVDNAGMERGLTALKTTITFHNTSQTRVFLLASWFNVAGSEITPVQPSESMNASEYRDYVKSSLPVSGTSSIPKLWDEGNDADIDCGRTLDSGQWFEPGEEQSRTLIIYVQKKQYDLVRIRASAIISKDPHSELTVLLVPDNEGALYPDILESAKGSGPPGSTTQLPRDISEAYAVSEFSLW